MDSEWLKKLLANERNAKEKKLTYTYSGRRVMSKEGYRMMTRHIRKIEFTKSRDFSNFVFFSQSSVALAHEHATVSSRQTRRIKSQISLRHTLSTSSKTRTRTGCRTEKEKGADEGKRGTNLNDERCFPRLWFFFSLFLFI